MKVYIHCSFFLFPLSCFWLVNVSKKWLVTPLCGHYATFPLRLSDSSFSFYSCFCAFAPFLNRRDRVKLGRRFLTGDSSPWWKLVFYLSHMNCKKREKINSDKKKIEFWGVSISLSNTKKNMQISPGKSSF